MNITTIKFLHELNNRFYQEQGASFAQTRGAPWHGWKRCLEILDETAAFSNKKSLSVLDFACGNMRFKTFMEQQLPDVTIDYFGLDNSDEMASKEIAASNYQSLDILNCLLAESDQLLHTRIQAPNCKLSVSFGFMHHIPGQQLRKKVLDLMIEKTLTDGHIIVSFWQFLKSPQLAAKAEQTHAQALSDIQTKDRADMGARSSADLDFTPKLLEYGTPASPSPLTNLYLEQGDYFLGWQNVEGAYRYCHSFSETEIDELITSVADKTQLIARFEADGRTQNLNSYIVLKRKY